MQVVDAGPGRARVRGRSGEAEVETRLVGPVEAGEWLLVFLGSARERISAARAAEVDATLELLRDVLAGGAAAAAPAFELPSARGAAELQALYGGPGRPMENPDDDR